MRPSWSSTAPKSQQMLFQPKTSPKRHRILRVTRAQKCLDAVGRGIQLSLSLSLSLSLCCFAPALFSFTIYFKVYCDQSDSFSFVLRFDVPVNNSVRIDHIFLKKAYGCILSFHSHSNSSITPDGWRMSGVWVEFSIGIHYLHSAFPHWSDTPKCKHVIREVLFLRAWKRH